MLITEQSIRWKTCKTCQFSLAGTMFCSKYNKECVKVQPEECVNAKDADHEWKNILNLISLDDQKETGSVRVRTFPYQTKSDMIRHPDHYTFRGTEAIEAVKILTATATGVEAYLLGCAVKYLYRYPRKNGDQDLAKAEQCIHMLREHLAKREAK